MLKISGTMINFIDKSTYTKDGVSNPIKGKLQILLDVPMYGGKIEKKLFNISIPDEKIPQYRDKVNKEVIVDVVLNSKEYSFYGI